MRLERRGDQWRATFTAMASPCELLLDLDAEGAAREVTEAAVAETRRIEAKFSRYRDDSVIGQINNAGGVPVEVDSETADLLDLAANCHQLSGGRFDVTTGVLRQIWRFDGSDRVPTRRQAESLRSRIGWHRIDWRRPWVSVPAGMELDLGGLGKEYAVDRVAGLMAEQVEAAVLVNFGGDLRARGTRRDGQAWQVGVERPGVSDAAALRLDLSVGALATSGDARRFLQRGGVRYPHILDPATAWPVMTAPRSVTVLADTCTEAGLLATLAMLKGRKAEAFLRGEGVQHWIIS